MGTNENQLLELIQKGEGISLEFKESKRTLNRSTYETVCAFLNRHGGTLLLGVSDDGTISGQVFVQYTLPEKPNSRMQKYQLTEKGRQLLKKMALK